MMLKVQAHGQGVKVSGPQVSAQRQVPSLLLGEFGERWLTVEKLSVGGKLDLQSALRLLRIFWWGVLKAVKV